MDKIRHWLYIGKYRETLDKRLLTANSIQAMLLLAELVTHEGIDSFYLPVEDLKPISVEHIKQGIDFIGKHKANRNRILVACGAGMNRSTAFCVAALKEYEGMGLLDAFWDIKKKHPEAMLHKPIWKSLCDYYDESVSYLDIMRVS